MNETELKTLIIQTLAEIAPEVTEAEIEADEDFRNQFDFDSMDFLNFTIQLSKKLNLEIPEQDTPKLSSLQGCLDYLQAKLA